VSTYAAVPANLSKRLPGRRYDRQFFFAMTVLLAAVVVIGFAPTYYLAGGFLAPLPSRIVHIHAAVFSTWMILLMVQTGLISAKRVGWHRKLGIAGFVLAIAMVVMVVLTAAGLAARVKGVPSMELVLGLLAVTFTDAFDFAVLAGFAYALRRDAAAHKAAHHNRNRLSHTGRFLSLARPDTVPSSVPSLCRYVCFSSLTGRV
jgi:hypothetical protein